MTSDPPHEDAESAARAPAARAPWWSALSLRLPLLLLCLAIAVFTFLADHTHILSASGSSSAASPSWCVPPGTQPSLQRVGIPELYALRTSLLDVIEPLAPRRYAAGILSPEDAWSDDLPQRLRTTEVDGRWPAGYEMRAWVTDPQLAPAQDDIALDVFMFAGDDEAQRFFVAASGTRCHRHGSASGTRQPPQTRDLVWLNPDGAIQEDAFVLRGPRVYRISDVRPQSQSTRTSEPARQAGISRVNAIACALPDAGCSR
jgi:hypothetical protein